VNIAGPMLGFAAYAPCFIELYVCSAAEHILIKRLFPLPGVQSVFA